MEDKYTERDETQSGDDWTSQMGFGGRNDSWMWGILLILLGALFLFGNLTGFELDNWWALFILFPAMSNLSSALRHYRSAGSFDRHVRSHSFWGIFFVLLSAAFLFDFSLALFWPAFLILAGLGLLLGGF